MTRHGLSLQERIERGSIPEPSCGCWLWTNGRTYGHIKIDGVVVRAHRASWLAFRGDIPDRMYVLHHCDNPTCVNPDHLFLGTHQDNMDDKERKGRGNQPSGDRHGTKTKPESIVRGDRHPARRIPLLHAGERNGRAVLTAEQVMAIRASPLGSWRAAKQYGVSKTTILKIRDGRLWGHL